MSRNPSPSMLKAITVTMIAKPGTVTSQGSMVRKVMPELIMFPQVGMGGFTPNPRKLKAASIRMAVAIQRLPMTMIGPEMLGITWKKRIPASLLPISRAASTYFSCLTESVAPRAIRMNRGKRENPMERMSVQKPGPMTTRMVRQSRIVGKAMRMSTRPTTRASNLPPR
jgi:hypothetical protein